MIFYCQKFLRKEKNCRYEDDFSFLQKYLSLECGLNLKFSLYIVLMKVKIVAEWLPHNCEGSGSNPRTSIVGT